MRAILKAREKYRQEVREKSQEKESEVMRWLERSEDEEDRSKPDVGKYYGNSGIWRVGGIFE